VNNRTYNELLTLLAPGAREAKASIQLEWEHIHPSHFIKVNALEEPWLLPLSLAVLLGEAWVGGGARPTSNEA